MLIHLSKSITYAIHALYYMSHYMKDKPIMARELSDAFDFPYDSMLKILRQLAKYKILSSHRGSKGGFTLRRNIEDINMLVLIESIEGPLEIVDPLSENVGDDCLRSVTIQTLYELTEKYKDLLKKISLGYIFDTRTDISKNGLRKELSKEDLEKVDSLVEAVKLPFDKDFE